MQEKNLRNVACFLYKSNSTSVLRQWRRTRARQVGINIAREQNNLYALYKM